MTSIVVMTAALIGAGMIALCLFAAAAFFALTPTMGFAWAALIVGGVFAVVALICGLIVSLRIQAGKRRAVDLATLASSGAASAALGFVGKRPLLSLGVVGALAALLMRGAGPSK